MNYKNLLHRVFLLISSPAKAWEEICMIEDKRSVMSGFVYPMISFCSLSVFIGTLLTNSLEGMQSVQMALTVCCGVAFALFGGYFFAAYLINKFSVRFFGIPDSIALARQFTGYAMVVTFLLKIIAGILPDFIFIGLLLEFYIVYVVWEGCVIVMHIGEKNRFSFTIFSSLLIVMCPVLIEFVFDKLVFLLN
ncbi:MAG: Yip1 family protein [Bacteroidaceae bacterium]